METKTCTKCGEVKPLSEFYKHKTHKDGHRYECKKCCSEYKKKYRSKNKDKLLEYQKEYRSENRDKLSEYMKDYQSKPENKERKKCCHLRRNFGITLDEYNEMLEAQEHRCAGCLIHEDELRIALAVDHCHQTGKIRGLLCNGCNVSLGRLNDNPTTLRRLAEYLEEHEK